MIATTFRLAVSSALIPALCVAVAAVDAQPPAPPAHVGMSDAAQIASAVAPLPKEMRDGATVMGWKGEALVTLRAGSNDMTCLGPDPKRPQFHTACYQNGMEPFMKRGRELRASGVTGDQVDSVRFREVRQKKIAMPNRAMSLYSLTGGTVDPATGEVKGARPLFVVYVPFATSKTTGLSTQPIKDGPWLMFPGTPKAHIMFQPSM
jgi:hypothetical protein